MLTPEQRDHLHPVSSFVWATDRRTLSGCPGRHAALRSAMAPWFARRDGHAPRPVGRGASPRSCSPTPAAAGAFDLYHDYALPVAVAYLADWLGIAPVGRDLRGGRPARHGRHVRLLARAGHAGDGRALPRADGPARPRAASPRRRVTWSRPGVLTERESWGVLYSISVSAVATATAAALAVGLVRRARPVAPDGRPGAGPARPSRRRSGSAHPFPQASRFAREHVHRRRRRRASPATRC